LLDVVVAAGVVFVCYLLWRRTKNRNVCVAAVAVVARHLAGILKELSSEKRPFFDAFFQIERHRSTTVDLAKRLLDSQRFKKRLGKKVEGRKKG